MSDSHRSATRTHGSLPAHRKWKWALFIAASALLFGVPLAGLGAVVTQHVINLTTASQTDAPVTFGQVFKDGDVPAGDTVTATLNGQAIPLQVDVKATNPDGSLRHAVLTFNAPSLAGGASMAVALSVAPPAATMAHGSPVSLSQLLATGYDATASLDVAGTTYSVNARGLLQAADLAGTCKSWGTACSTWLSGPLVSEWVVNGPVTAANGTTNPNLRVYFAVRAYAGTAPGTVGRVRTDIIVENTLVYGGLQQAQPQYTATLTSGSASYTSPALTQYAYTRWHRVLWWNNADPDVYLQQDTQYLQNSLAISRYEPLQPDESFLAGLRQSCAPLDHCDQTKTMSNVGAQPAIGPLPRWTSVYIIDPDVRAYHWMLANTDALGAYSIHYRDVGTGFPVSIQDHPYVTEADWSFANTVARQNSTKGANYRADLLQNCVNNDVVSSCSTAWYSTGNPNKWDSAHQPAESYVPYMVTGSYYYMSELAFGASQNEMYPNETYRGFSQGVVGDAYGPVRGKAWVLREMADAAWLLPDTHPLKAEFNADVNNSFAAWNQQYTDNPDANPLHVMTTGVVYDLNGGKLNGVAPWQHNFLSWSVGHAADLGFAGAAAFRDWLVKFEIGLMTDWRANPTQGYCWLDASSYSIQVKDASGNWLPDYTSVYGTTFPTLVGLECNSPAMVDALGNLKGQPWQGGEMTGYANSATGYPANFQIGVAAAADSGVPNAETAWSIFDSRSVKPSGSVAYNNYPNFAVIPRTVSAGPVPPPTQPPPADPPTTPPPAHPPNTPPPAARKPPTSGCPTVANVLPRCGGTVAPQRADSGRSGATSTPNRPTHPGRPGVARIDRNEPAVARASGATCARFSAWCRGGSVNQAYKPDQTARRRVTVHRSTTQQIPGSVIRASAPVTITGSPKRNPRTAAQHAASLTTAAVLQHACSAIASAGDGRSRGACRDSAEAHGVREPNQASPCYLLVVTGAGTTRQPCDGVADRR